MANILIVDDEKIVCETLFNVVQHSGHNATYALTIEDALKEVCSKAFDVVFLDVWMPDGNGLDILPKIRKTQSSPEVIVMTGKGNPDGAEIALQKDAWDYIQKPSTFENMKQLLVRALQYREGKTIQEPMESFNRDTIVGNSSQMLATLELLAQVSKSNVNTLITGETGTGKELFAQAIHANSDRRKNSFIVVDCAALPESLIESVLFGHVRSAFTGADKASEGLIQQANGGTLFLDEVGEIPISLQKNFLRVLQERRFRPIGGKHELTSDFRLVAATNRNLEKMVQTGTFRSDLLFRLRSFLIDIPPLRERLDDIKALAQHHMLRLCERSNMRTKVFSSEFHEALTAYQWPGNVRELLSALERTLIAAGNEPTLFSKHLPLHIRIQIARSSTNLNSTEEKGLVDESNHPSGPLATMSEVRNSAISKVERQYLQNLMALTNGNIKQASQISGLSTPRIYALIKKYAISRLK